RPETETPPAPRKTPEPPTTGSRARGVFGRDQDVEKLARLVAERPLVSVYGLPAVGKSTLGEELLHTKEHAGIRYHHVRIHEVTTFKRLFQQLAPALGAGNDPADERFAVMSRFSVLEKWAKKAEPTLIHLERAHLLLDDGGQRLREPEVGALLAAIADKCGDVRVVLEGRRAPGKEALPADVHETMRVGGLGSDDLADVFRTPP
ncbi:MAG: ATP-binding protein, partial [Deltaproteobacteria bacterium]|nr:ATP-binding protein [Deltaproteobacteria bacterium]